MTKSKATLAHWNNSLRKRGRVKLPVDPINELFSNARLTYETCIPGTISVVHIGADVEIHIPTGESARFSMEDIIKEWRELVLAYDDNDIRIVLYVDTDTSVDQCVDNTLYVKFGRITMLHYNMNGLTHMSVLPHTP